MQITAISPSHAADIVDITVTTPTGTSTTSANDQFTYLLLPTTTTLSVNPNPVNNGQPVTLTATISPSTTAGQVNFYDGINLLGTASLSSG